MGIPTRHSDIPHRVKRLFSALRDAGVHFSQDGCGFLAQALAFNALFALLPLLVLMLTGASLVFPHAEHRALHFIDTAVPALHDFIATSLQSYIYGRGISSIVAFAIIVWSGKNLFMGIAYALDRSLDVPKGRPLVHNIVLSIAMLPIIGVVLIIAMALPIAISIAMKVANISDRQNLTHLAAYVISIALVFIISMTLYRFLPNRRLSWRFAIPGAAFVAIVWPIVQYGFALYTLHVRFSLIYGALSVPLVLLLWLYLIGSIFLFGAEFCSAWARTRHKSSVAL